MRRVRNDWHEDSIKHHYYHYAMRRINKEHTVSQQLRYFALIPAGEETRHAKTTQGKGDARETGKSNIAQYRTDNCDACNNHDAPTESMGYATYIYAADREIRPQREIEDTDGKGYVVVYVVHHERSED